MAYFSDDFTRSRLYILYLMSRLSIPLHRGVLISALMECSHMDYFDSQLLLLELEESGHILCVEGQSGVELSLSEKGGNTVFLFTEQLPLSLRLQCDEYAEENRSRLRKNAEITARQLHSRFGCDCILGANEKGSVLVSMDINVPNDAIADKLCKNWHSRAHIVYEAILEILTEEE